MDLRQLRYFAAVVEAGSLTSAAAQLHMSQPPLSVAIGKLESELGAALLVRTARGVEPTAAGRYLLDASSRILGEVEEVRAAMRRFGAGTAGSITIAAVPVLMWQRIPAVLRAHAVVAPDVDVRLVDPPPWTAIDMLQQRAVDIALINVAEPKRFAERHSGIMDAYDCGEVPLVAALPPDEATAPDPFPLAAFEGSLLVLPRRTSAVPSLPEVVDETLRSYRINPAGVRTVETIQTSIPLIEAGIARGILPDPSRASLTRFEIQTRRLDPEPPPLRTLLLTRHDSRSNPAIARLIACMSEASHPLPPAEEDPS